MNKTRKYVVDDFEYKDEKQKRHFKFLDRLRAVGRLRMVAYVEVYFSDSTAIKVPSKVFEAWVDTFEDRGCPGSDK